MVGQVDARRMPRGQARDANRNKQTTHDKAEQTTPSDTLMRQRASNELVKLIRKLRWLGMEEEAQDLEDELKRRHAAAADSVLATAAETD